MRTPIAAMVALACLATPAFAMSDTECQDLWKKADANSDGVLSDAETGRYLAGMRMHQVRIPENGRIDQQVFMDNCKRDVFKTADNQPGAPLKGANSFTEDQAKDRAMARGYTSVSDLKKDGDGIWRGNAMMDGKTKKAGPNGIADIANLMTGFTVVRAASHEAAARLFESHPHFAIFPGEAVEKPPRSFERSQLGTQGQPRGRTGGTDPPIALKLPALGPPRDGTVPRPRKPAKTGSASLFKPV